MKLLVTEMPLNKRGCPFAKEYDELFWDGEMSHRTKVIFYDCKVTKTDCDLDCGKCSGLQLLEVKE